VNQSATSRKREAGNNMAGTGTAGLYICFPHLHRDGEDIDFSDFARQLKAAGLEASYDSIALAPGEALWERIAPWITCGEIMGCAYILTPGNTRNPVGGELVAALERAHTERGGGFPLTGLLHGLSAENLPLPIKLRPWIHLADPNWRERLKNSFNRRAPEDASEFQWTIHNPYMGNASQTAIEVCPRSEVVRCWRFAVPSSVRPVRWGHGSSGGGDISPVKFSVTRGAGRLKNVDITWFGSEDTLSPSESAYLVFHGALPDFVCFGRAKNPASPPGKMELLRTG
jgi:hypothetical protein